MSSITNYNSLSRIVLYRAARLPNNKIMGSRCFHYRNLVDEINIFDGRIYLFTYQNSLRSMLEKLIVVLKEQSVKIASLYARQCECVAAHRIRRSQQIYSLYQRLWDEEKLRKMIQRIRQQFARRGRLLLGGSTVSLYTWENDKISDEEMIRHTQDLNYIHSLRDNTATCPKCRMRQVIDHQVSNISYCKCKESTSVYNKSAEGYPWLPFMERQDLLVWRQENVACKGLYIYKVYGSYDDVTANDFLRVQTDIKYRSKWDKTVVELRVIESDPKSNSDVIYWEMQWPRFFSNRDYVFNRRLLKDSEKKVMVIVNKCTKHPFCPKKPNSHRVEEYWSVMLIKPYTEFDEPGIEFGLTYFDNPGLSIPSAVAAWVAMNGLPDFLSRVRIAAKDLQQAREVHHQGLAPSHPVCPSPVVDTPHDSSSPFVEHAGLQAPPVYA